MHTFLAPRDPFTDVKTTLSSWDNCMAKTYCKWPVIAVIIIGGLIALSVVLCIARCICCGAECVCCCFRCCACCCGGGRKPRSGHQRVASEPAPTYPTGYAAAPYPANSPAGNPYAQAHAAAPPPPMNFYPVDKQYQAHAAPTFNPQTNPAFNPQTNPTFNPQTNPTFNPQTNPTFATFETNESRKPVNEDALPPMPSWGEARSVHVEVEERVVPQRRGDMEMDRLNYNGSIANSSTGGVAAMNASARRIPAPSPGPGPMSPVSPLQENYNHAPGYSNDSLVSAMPQQNTPDQYHRPYPQQDDYHRRGSPAHSVSPLYGAREAHTQNAQNYTQDPYNREPAYIQQPPPDRYNSPAPPSYTTNDYTQQQQQPQRSHTPAYAYQQQQQQPQRSNTPAYASTASTLFEPPSPSHTPTPAPTPASAYPGQQSYQAFRPGGDGQQYTGVVRKAVGGSYREV